MEATDELTAPPGATAVRPWTRWLRVALVVAVVLLVAGLLVATAIAGLTADPMAGTWGGG